MPRKINPKIEEAKNLYKDGYKLIEIAEQLEIPEGTIRSWKNRYKWDDDATLQKKVLKKCNVAKDKSPPKSNQKNKTLAEVEQVLKNPDLTDKQRLFCLYQIKYFNATKAYQKAYGCAYSTAMVEGSKSLRNPKIQEEIRKLKQTKLNQATLEPGDIFQKYMDMAFSDITDYLTFGKKSVEYMDKEGNEQQVEVNYVNLNESSNIDGSLITEIRQGKDGVSIKLADRMKALQWLADHMELATEEQRLKVAKLNKELGENNKEPIKIEFIKASQRGETDE